LNRLLVDLQQEEDDSERVQFIHTLLSRYVLHGRPLTGYFIVCCVTEVQWTVLTQCVFPPEQTSAALFSDVDEAEAANLAWQALLRSPIPEDVLQYDDELTEALQNGLRLAMLNFTELLVQIEDMDTDPAADTYAWETMSESLVSAYSCYNTKP
jgi:phosphatidylinositol 4-kinase